ncbi:MAG: TIGR00341 family protein, partial [Desulfuromonadales bacterium]
MNLRLLEIILPALDAEDVLQLMGEQNLLNTWLGIWTETLDGDLARVRVLLPAQETEKVSDLLVNRFGTLETFRILFLPVEATIPQPEEVAEEVPKTEDKEAGKRSGRLSREELYADISEGTNLTVIFAVMVVLSSVVAAIGLIRSNVAVIIGAMVMAPLIRPNMAMALAATLGDLPLALRSSRANIVGLLIGVALSALIGYFFAFDPGIPEIASRTRVGVGEVILALAAGSAGALSFSTGISAALIGVM